MTSVRQGILAGDCVTVMRMMETASVHTCVTSPPYWGLRDYGVDGQIGREDTPEIYVDRIVNVFREVWRVLRDDGTLWLVLGDTYCTKPRGSRPASTFHGGLRGCPDGPNRRRLRGFKGKDLIGIPWRVALALQQDGWYLRSDIIWSKPNPMPESAGDRPTKSHDYVFLLTKQSRYFFDAAAISEPCSPNTHLRLSQDVAAQVGSLRANGGSRPDRPMKTVVNGKLAAAGEGVKYNESFAAAVCLPVERRNVRTVWTIPVQGFSEAHFAVYPEELAARCVLAGSPDGGTVLDPFVGSGTTGVVCRRLGRNFIGIELNKEYAAMARRRIANPDVRRREPVDPRQMTLFGRERDGAT